jgi:hypothetical protein
MPRKSWLPVPGIIDQEVPSSTDNNTFPAAAAVMLLTVPTKRVKSAFAVMKFHFLFAVFP